MGDIISLRRARKDRERRERELQAQSNRAAFGRPKSERTLTEARAKLEADRHEAHRLDGQAPDKNA